MQEQPRVSKAQVPAPDAAAPQRLFEQIERFGNSTALICEDGSSLSYAELAERADAAVRSVTLARALISVEMPNQLEAILFYIGALRAGHVVIPTAGGDADTSVRLALRPNFGFASTGEKWALTDFEAGPIDMAPDLAVLLSTSGSTGSQKYVRLSHQNLLSNACAIASYLELQPGERAIMSLPAYYSYGLSILHSHLLMGHTIVLSEHSVTDARFWERVERDRVSSIAGVPHTYQMLELGGFLDRDYPSLRYLTQAGGKLSPDLVRRFAQWAERSGKRFYVMYGQTEAAPRIAYLPPIDAATFPDCIGIAIPGGVLRLEPIGDSAGLPEGAGELVYRGPNVMLGYATSREDLLKPQTTDEVWTGDIAVCNDRGYFRIVGRTSRFAKLFGLRIGFDDIERRLSDAGIQAAVSGDDTGLVVATSKKGSADTIRSSLAQDLDIPAYLISVVEVEEIPRLASGKTDYATIRTFRRDTSLSRPSSLVAEITMVLGQEDLDTRCSFTELGGDSLNYVQMVLALEKHLGYVPNGWENTPIRQLATLAKTPGTGTEAGAAKRSNISIKALDLARSGAIFLALLMHCFYQVSFHVVPELQFVVRTATPMLMILFGVMIPLLYAPRTAQADQTEAFQDFLTKSLQCYALYALSVLAFWLTIPSGWLYALGSLALVGAMPYSQILIFYGVMFLLVPPILFAIKRVGFWTLFAAALAVHMAFIPLKMVPAPPEFYGQPVFQRLLDLLIGAGAAPYAAGPSILHSFVLLLAGYWLGFGLRRSAESRRPGLQLIRSQIPMMALFAVGLAFAFSIPAYPVDWIRLVSMDLRNLNHPAYVFFFGLICIALLILLLVSNVSARAPNWLMTMGRRSLFAFGVGNAIILVWPRDGLPFLSPLPDGLLLMSLLIALTYSFDYCMRTGRYGHGLARLVFDLTNGGSRKIAALAGLIVHLFTRNNALMRPPADETVRQAE